MTDTSGGRTTGPRVEHYVNGQRAFTLADASDILHIADAALRQRVHDRKLTAAGWINPRLPVYYAEDLGIPEDLMPTTIAGYSRPLPMYIFDVQPGDQVDISATKVGAWRIVVAVSECDSDHCNGACIAVLTLEQTDEPGDPRWWHVQPEEQLSVRLACLTS